MVAREGIAWHYTSLAIPLVGHFLDLRLSGQRARMKDRIPNHKLQPEPTEQWYRTITRSTLNLSEKYDPIDRTTAQRMARLLVASLVPRRCPGRTPSAAVTTAG